MNKHIKLFLIFFCLGLGVDAELNAYRIPGHLIHLQYPFQLCIVVSTVMAYCWGWKIVYKHTEDKNAYYSRTVLFWIGAAMLACWYVMLATLLRSDNDIPVGPREYLYLILPAFNVPVITYFYKKGEKLILEMEIKSPKELQ